MRARIALALLLAFLSVACGGQGDEAPAPAPTSTAPPPSSTTPTSAALQPTPTIDTGTPRSTTTAVLSLGPGEASLSGVVNGPAGPVSGARIRVERLVGNRAAVTEVRADDSGSWSVASILGGPYRVTAFRPPDLGVLEPELFFLGVSERRTVPVTLQRFADNTITARIRPNPPRVGAPATFTVRVGTGAVDDNGVVVVRPTPAARLQLVSEGLAIESPAQLTDGDGRVTWQVQCLGTGSFPVGLFVGTATTTVPFPACAEGSPEPADGG